MFMHNGNIGGWKYVKRALGASLADKWFMGVKGGTDSEWAFALFLDLMEKAGADPSSDPGPNGFGQAFLRKIMLQTVAKINEFIRNIPKDHHVSDMETRSLLNFALTDGHTVICTRYVSSKTDEAASLYFSSGTKWKEGQSRGHYKMERHDKGADVVLVASEPLTFDRRKHYLSQFHNLIHSIETTVTNVPIDNWVTVPTNTILTIQHQTVLMHPIKDEFYDDSPFHNRSSCYADSKGLVSKAPVHTTSVPDSGSMTPDVGDGTPRKTLGGPIVV